MDNNYLWNNSKTVAHNELLPEIIGAFKTFVPNPAVRVLDAGCGGGYILKQLKCNGYSDLWGIDLSRSGIMLAKKESPDLEERFAIHDACSSVLPPGFPKSEYDVVISIEVVEHLFDPKSYLKNINSWLKPGGFLILSTPYHGYLKNLAISLVNKWDDHHTVDWDIGHIKFFSKKTIEKMLQTQGFRVRGFYGVGRCWGLWKSMLVVAQKV